MPYEFDSDAGLLRLVRTRGRWVIVFKGTRAGAWATPNEAARALVERRSGLADWDAGVAPVPGDLLDWRPVGDSI